MSLNERIRTGWTAAGLVVGWISYEMSDAFWQQGTGLPYPLDIEQHGRHVLPSFAGSLVMTTLFRERLLGAGLSEKNAHRIAQVSGAASLIALNLALELPPLKHIFPNTTDILADTVLYGSTSAVAGALMVREATGSTVDEHELRESPAAHQTIDIPLE